MPQSFPPPPDCPDGFIYTVKESDNLWDIAQRFSVPHQDLIDANPQIQNPDLIFPGQRICVPKPKPDVIKLLKKIIKILEDEEFGLEEIKSEVAGIEDEIPVILNFLDTILDILEDEEFGLFELFQLITEILELLEDEGFGLEEIKEEIEGIEGDIPIILTALNTILDILEDEEFGLFEVKEEIIEILELLEDKDFGLEEIKEEVEAIEVEIPNLTQLLELIRDLLQDDEFGLDEIKDEIRDIEAAIPPDLSQLIDDILDLLDKILDIVGALDPFAEVLTTGPIRHQFDGARRVTASVLNNTGDTKEVTVIVYDLMEDPKEEFDTATFTLDPGESDFHIFDAAAAPSMYEVEFVGMQPGVYGWTALRTGTGSGPVIAGTVYRHAELVPQFDS